MSAIHPLANHSMAQNAGGTGWCEQAWETLPGGDAVRLFTARNAQGAKVTISDLGGTLVSWQSPDRSGRLGEVLLGFEHPAQYLDSGTYMGALIGRWANRIAGARFRLDGIDYRLDRNEGSNMLHGGASGFQRVLWDVEIDGQALVLRYVSPEGDAGFPGQVDVTVTYTFDDEGTLGMVYEAVSDAPTPVNFTSHPYFNLSARRDSEIHGHMLLIDAEQFFEVNAELIPVQRAAVAGSAFDFRQNTPIGARLDWPDAQLALARGFDHCYVLRKGAQDHDGRPAVRAVARAYEPGSGRELTVFTDQCGLQFYTGNYLSGMHVPYGGFCLEAGGYPNQVNMPDAESVILRPGHTYRQETRYRIGILA